MSAFPWLSGASREAAVGLPGITAEGDGAANRFTSVTPWVAQQRPIVVEASHVSRRKVDTRDRDCRNLRNISDRDYAPPASLRARRLLVHNAAVGPGESVGGVATPVVIYRPERQEGTSGRRNDPSGATHPHLWTTVWTLLCPVAMRLICTICIQQTLRNKRISHRGNLLQYHG